MPLLSLDDKLHRCYCKYIKVTISLNLFVSKKLKFFLVPKFARLFMYMYVYTYRTTGEVPYQLHNHSSYFSKCGFVFVHN